MTTDKELPPVHNWIIRTKDRDLPPFPVRAAYYRNHGEWFEFKDEHQKPVYLVAADAVLDIGRQAPLQLGPPHDSTCSIDKACAHPSVVVSAPSYQGSQEDLKRSLEDLGRHGQLPSR